MNHAQLRAFHAVATTGGFSRAAARLGLTQPAVSDQVRKLEEGYDVRLFDRHNRSVSLTPLGQRLLEITRRYFDAEQAADALLSDSRALRVGHIRVSADAPLHVMPVIADFRARHPGVTVSLRRGNSDAVLRHLLDFTADIGVLAHVPPGETRLEVRPLREDPFVALVARDHPWAARAAVRMADLDGVPLVFRETGSTTRAAIEAAFARHALAPRVVLEVEGREAVREAVALGMGVGFVSGSEIGHDGRLAAVTLTDCGARMTESLVCLKDRAGLRHLAAFLDCVPGPAL
jgi:aminoethylphosphonate catabolism LysR family transcriptional regulator